MKETIDLSALEIKSIAQALPAMVEGTVYTGRFNSAPILNGTGTNVGGYNTVRAQFNTSLVFTGDVFVTEKATPEEVLVNGDFYVNYLSGYYKVKADASATPSVTYDVLARMVQGAVPNLDRVAYVDSAFVGLGAPFFTVESDAVTYLEALTPATDAANPCLLKSFLKPASQSVLDKAALLAEGIVVERIDDGLNKPLELSFEMAQDGDTTDPNLIASFKNDFGVAITLSRTIAGNYFITAASPIFTVGKTLVPQARAFYDFNWSGVLVNIRYFWVSTTVIGMELQAADGSMAYDGFEGEQVVIKVYP